MVVVAIWDKMRTKSKVVKTKPPADFEEVKRRFIRQNRELAKNNSGQSLRIRSLELEVSRLLADNLELRNQVNHLKHEVYAAQKKASNSAARRVKDQMRAKIAALSAIVDSIEEDEEPVKSPVQRKPIEGNWRERQTLSELMRDTAMPTIVEDKHFPRRTLGADDLQPIRLSDQSSNGSPDLGPPPVAHFDYEDPVKNASPLTSKTSPPKPETENDDEALPAALTVNLETRRKRKDSSSRLEIRRSSLLGETAAKIEEEKPSILRTGAKRKLADRENDKPIKPPSKGDFTFSRKVNGEETKPKENPKPSTPEDDPKNIVVQSPASRRKVLGEKSTNMSPRKTVTTSSKGEKDGLEKPAPSRLAASKDATTTRRRRTSSIPVPSPPREAPQVIEIAPTTETGPMTPAALDLFSPTTSEPSAKPEGREGTPPPGDLSTLSTTTDAGRGSRRARSAVNYAEPSLISKMRRPDKKMVDAVTGLQDPRRAMGVSGEKRVSNGPFTIKKEPPESEDGEAWKSLPPATHVEPSSPLGQKGSTEGLRSEAVFSPDLVQVPENKPSASQATISALMAGGRRRRQSIQEEPLGKDIDVDAASIAKKLEEMDLYDFKDSSSPATNSSGVAPAESKPARTVSVKTHRRHSSVSKASRPVGGGLENAFSTNSTSAEGRLGTAAAGKAERLANRRRSTAL